ncbi:MAG: polyketide cyclase [Maribacter sp.]|nr:polyketide cyclase [Maribacter sp.]
MLIRKPVSVVYDAFIDPEITTKFWFTKSSGRLDEGKTIKWEWEMYDASTEIIVKQIIPKQKITIAWGNPSTTVEFKFTELTNQATYVVIRNFGFHQTGPDLIETIKDSTSGFTTVIDGLKAYLEFDIELNLVRDKFPQNR